MGVSQTSTGVSQASVGLAQAFTSVSQASAGVSQMFTGVSQASTVLAQAFTSVSQASAGVSQMSTGVSPASAGISQMFTGLTQAFTSVPQNPLSAPQSLLGVPQSLSSAPQSFSSAPQSLSGNFSRCCKLRENDEDCYHQNGRRTGRPKAILPAELQTAVDSIDNGPCVDASDVQRVMLPHVNLRTLEQELAAEGFKGFRQCKKPLLLPQHIEACQKFSKEHLDWEQLDVFHTAHVLFSDKSKFIIHGLDGKQYCRR
ncbi:hypothetical protein BT96DRAFT_997609 [Gymnopus androsaceus JB14]|uniref:Uncharacterized protein n=1 Tax=Gymnopus androsaceus JB14 TaxID=1447944 RepID=A0A6A4HCQ1_9AGAR|nr:hypothetical protein BT96DRAFT_997609 [Gymnopus androsaceus JB14]